MGIQCVTRKKLCIERKRTAHAIFRFVATARSAQISTLSARACKLVPIPSRVSAEHPRANGNSHSRHPQAFRVCQAAQLEDGPQLVPEPRRSPLPGLETSETTNSSACFTYIRSYTTYASYSAKRESLLFLSAGIQH